MTTSSHVTRPSRTWTSAAFARVQLRRQHRFDIALDTQYVLENGGLANAVRSLISSLPAGTRFTVVHHKSSRAAIEQWFSNWPHANSITYVPLSDYVNFTIWAEEAGPARTRGYAYGTEGRRASLPYLLQRQSISDDARAETCRAAHRAVPAAPPGSYGRTSG